MSGYKKICSSLLSNQDGFSVMLIGDIGENLEKFATQMLMTFDQHNVNVIVNTTNKLPIQDSQENEVLYVSLIVILIDVTNKESLLSAKKSLSHVPIDFFMGKLIVLGLNVTEEHLWSIEPEEVENFARDCDFCPVLWTDISEASSCSNTSSQILQKLKLLSSNHKFCSTLLSNKPLRF